MILLIAVFITIAYIFLVVKSIQAKKWLHFLPSSTWFSIMVVPYILHLTWANQSFTNSQGWGIFIVFFFLISGDFCGQRFYKDPSAEMKVVDPGRVLRIIAYLCVLLIPLVHFLIARQIPILHLFDAPESIPSLSSRREEFSKLATYPYIFKVFPNLYFTLIAPLALAFCYKMKYKMSFAFLMAWSIFYSVSSSAEFSILILISMTVFGITFSQGLRSLSLVKLLAFLSLSATIASGVAVESELLANPQQCLPRVQTYTSVADKFRVCRELNHVIVNSVVDRIGYRVFLTPIDVSSWWYKYYLSNPHRSVGSLISRDLNYQPSNIIGRVAYFDRFPNSYLESVSAYSSLDADAFSFGWIFLWVSAFLVFLMRILAGLGLVSKYFFVRTLAGILFGGLIIFPFTASIQAILIAQGLALPFILLFVLVKKTT